MSRQQQPSLRRRGKHQLNRRFHGSNTGCISCRLLFVSWLVFATMTAAFSMNPNKAVSPPLISATNVRGQPSYAMASVDLSQAWIQLVQNHQVVATVTLPPKDGTEDDVTVQYGVALQQLEEEGVYVCQEFVKQIEDNDDDTSKINSKVQEMTRTLQSLQEQALEAGTDAWKPALQWNTQGPFAAQLQLVRTLRPPPSAGFDTCTAGTKTTSRPPPYDATIDSFVTGPLRLPLRPRVGTLNLPATGAISTPWDVYHNISPADTRGHFLLIPTLDDPEGNWREQRLTSRDCHDLVHLTSSIQPVGSLLVGFNSVGAGASQNHVHAHAWPSPPLSGPYAVTQVPAIQDFCDIASTTTGATVEVSWLKYPVCCVQLSTTIINVVAEDSNQERNAANLQLLGQALATTLEAIGDAPYNVGFLNRLEESIDDEETTDEQLMAVDVFVFVRSQERATTVLPTLKLGISEMMGVFHAQSQDELTDLVNEKDTDSLLEEDDHDHDDEDDHGEAEFFTGPMARALQEISCDNEVEIWEAICQKLQKLENVCPPEEE